MNYLETVKEAIRKSKITQKQLSDNIGVTLDQLTNILNGRTTLKIPVRKAIDDFFYEEFAIDLTENIENVAKEPESDYKRTVSRNELEEKCKHQEEVINDLRYLYSIAKDTIEMINNQYLNEKKINDVLINRLSKYENVEKILITTHDSDLENVG